MQSSPAGRQNEEVARTHQVTFSRGLIRLLSAAVASSQFGRMLLADPIAAVTAGYSGERFYLTPDELVCLSGIRADSLREFAAQLVSKMQGEWAPAYLHSEMVERPELRPMRVQAPERQKWIR